MLLRYRTLLIPALLTLTGCPDHPKPPAPATTEPARAQATQPATAPATAPAVVEVKPPVMLLDVVRRNDASFPTTQPLDEPVELSAAARLKMTEPVYLCSRGDLWITRDDALPTAQVLSAAFKQQTHVTRERVQFVYWRPGARLSAELVVRETEADASVDVWVTAAGRYPLDAKLTRDWSRAIIWNSDRANAVVVPSTTGMSIIRVVDGKLDERYVPLVESAAPGVSTQAVFDLRGVLAWSVLPGGQSTVARFVDDAWTTLTPNPMWPKQLLHVVPFLDGTLLAIAKDANELRLRSVLLDSVAVDEAKVTELVKKLADRNPKTREEAQAALSLVGPGAWPILQKIQSAQPAEARVRIRAVLGDQNTPTLGGVTPEPGAARMVCRLSDGGVVLYFAEGASSVDSNGVVQKTTPAWFAVRPSQLVRALPESLTRGLNPASAPLKSWGEDEWILEHDVDGPMRWMGNHNERLTRPVERDFKRFVGIDAASRWIFKTIDPNGPTLVLDPTLPDPRPKLPVWTVTVNGGAVGWTEEGWPVQQRGGAWVLKESTWVPMKPEDVETKFKQTLAPTTAPSTLPIEPEPLLTDAKGNRYYGGLSSLTVRMPNGSQTDWPLPPEAIGEGVIDGAPVLIEADDRLFLCNAPGKLIRISRQFEKTEPFKLDTVFTRHLPATDIRRIWEDPAGRLVIASSGNRLSICFPSGRISNAMSNMIPANALREAMEGEVEK